MSKEREVLKEATGRQGAYRARTRKALLKSAQEVLAEVGLTATIEDLASKAEVSPATIYNHFGSKELYLKEAMTDIWEEALLQAYSGRSPGEGIETKLDVCRKLFRINQSNSLLGRVLSKTLSDGSFVIEALRPNAETSFKDAARKGGLNLKDFDTRMEVWSHALVGIFQGVFVTKKMSPKDADKALSISLSIWGFDEKLAEKLTTKPISS
jgi:AcrR family transcriptional regulator